MLDDMIDRVSDSGARYFVATMANISNPVPTELAHLGDAELCEVLWDLTGGSPIELYENATEYAHGAPTLCVACHKGCAHVTPKAA